MNDRYTVWDVPDVDRFVEEQLNLIVTQVANTIGNDLEAIVLGGGFGRGEGSVLINVDGSMHVVNDYDMEIVCRERWGSLPSKLINRVRFQNKLGHLEKTLAARLQLKQLDFGLRTISDYAQVTVPRLADFDLKYGHRLLYGSWDPVSALSNFKSTDIPLFEGTWLLRNRGIGLLLARLYFLDDEKIPTSKHENFYIEITKAILAMGDALFILNSCYVCSYAERAARFHSLPSHGFSAMFELIQLYSLAAQYKLKPQALMYPDMPPITLWRHVVRLYILFFLFFETQRLKIAFTNIREYAAWVTDLPSKKLRQYPRWVFEQISGMMRGFSPRLIELKHDKAQSILFVILLLACHQDNYMDKQAMDLMEHFFAENNANITEQQWKKIVRDFLLLIHPGGEVGRFLIAK